MNQGNCRLSIGISFDVLPAGLNSLFIHSYGSLPDKELEWHFTPSLPNVTFLYLSKTSRNLKVFWCFQEVQKQPPEVFCEKRCSVKKGVPKNFAKFTEFSEISKNTFFVEHLWTTASRSYKNVTLRRYRLKQMMYL